MQTAFAGTETDIANNFSGIDTLNATGTGSLTGRDVDSIWTLNGTSYNVGGDSLDFSGFVDIYGGSANDTFNVTADVTHNLFGGGGDDIFNIKAALNGTLDGGAGADILQGVQIDAVILTSSDGNGFAGTEAAISGGFAGIQTLTGNGGTLMGEDTASTWTLDGTPTYNDGSNTLNISGFANLQGGSITDASTSLQRAALTWPVVAGMTPSTSTQPCTVNLMVEVEQTY